jgi:hypothetical protein
LIRHTETIIIQGMELAKTIWFLLFLDLSVSQTPPFVPDECLTTDFNDCIQNCQCIFCYSGEFEGCLPFAKAYECKNHTSSTPSCNEAKKENTKVVLIASSILISISIIVVAFFFVIYLCFPTKNFFKTIKRKASRVCCSYEVTGFYEQLL